MSKTLTTTEAEIRFAESLRLAEAGKIVEITREGRPVAAIVGAQELDRLQRLKAARPQERLASLLGLWEDGAELADEIDRGRR